ncbi:MAG: DUF86 domain-containing protein [Bacteroidetes bacterium]|nr:DUF86 domain-containing protein [Bacteroidota bacterium]
MQPAIKNDIVFLLIILESIGKIEIYKRDFNSGEVFFTSNDQLNFNASLLLLANIGEQCSKISDELKDKYPKVEWQKIKNIRNRIVHDYTGIDSDLTFNIINTELVPLRNSIHQIIANELKTGNFNSDELKFAGKSAFYSHVNFKAFM